MKVDLNKRIAERLSNLRKEKGLTLAEVAKATGISESFLSKLERSVHQCTLANLACLAAFYGVKPSVFVEERGDG